MDHLVYLDYKAKELTNLDLGKKTMLVRGAMGRKIPYESVKKDDELYFVENKGELVIKAKACVASVYFSKKLTYEESFSLIDKYQNVLLLNTAMKKKFAGKRYLTLITLRDFMPLQIPIEIDKTKYSNINDWLIVKDINSVLVQEEV